MKIDEEKLSTIIDSIEDFSRRKIADYDSKSDISYIDNSDYNLRKMKKSNNNIIEARRGCGKTTIASRIVRNFFEKSHANQAAFCSLSHSIFCSRRVSALM